LSWALTLLGLRWLDRSEADDKQRGSGLAAVVVGNLLACGLALPLALPVEAARAVDWTMIAYLGVIQIGMAYVLLTHGFQRVPAFEASLLILLEPALNPVWAWLFQGEVPGRWALTGGVTIFGASIGKSWLEQRGKRLTQRPNALRSSPRSDSGGHQK
jgi:drug/metabolite transporter (DMT)-like permease